MAVTKRTRYEVLKRDNHTCRYCHAVDSPLTVDHVTPVALGGTDDPSNLAAACRDCNAGKSSTPPDSQLVEDVRGDALRHAELTRQAYAVLVERMGDRDDYIAEWAESWTQPTLYLPDEWELSVGRWFEMGVPVEIVADAARIACTRKGIAARGRFTYMAGIVWSQVKMVDQMAEARRHLDGRFMSDSDLTDVRYEEWRQGWNRGYLACAKDAARCDPLSVIIDQIEYPADPWAVTA